MTTGTSDPDEARHDDANAIHPTRKLERLSIIVPCFNEQEVISETYNRLIQCLAGIPCQLEIIFVNDGSKDSTWSILCHLASTDDRIVAIDLSRNFGHQLAVTAGIDHATGDATVIIDADLQDPPEAIAGMLKLWNDGWDVVYGQRISRTGESTLKKLTAFAFYRLINMLSDVPIPVDTGDFRLLDRRVVEALRQMPERDRFLRGMIAWLGFRQCPFLYERAARWAGQTHYPLRAMFRLAINGIVSFSIRPLRLVTLIGMTFSAISLLAGIAVVANRLFTTNWVPGWSLLTLLVLFLGGLNLFCMGILGEYIGRIYQESKKRPIFLISDIQRKRIP